MNFLTTKARSNEGFNHWHAGRQSRSAILFTKHLRGIFATELPAGLEKNPGENQ
jgi:hypothetical protein